MAVIEARIAPFIRKVFTITGTQYHYSGSGDPHGGLDLSTGFKDDLYIYLLVLKMIYTQW